jgi:CRP-like cAMP-binding protein
MHSAVAVPNPAHNHLLCALPHAALERLCSHLEPVALALGQVIFESNQRINYGYFLTNSIVSLLYTTENGATAEIALVGNDGIVGAAIFLGGESTCGRAVVAVAGQAFRIPARFLLKEFERSPDLQHVLLRYVQALITQISQTAVCNRLHSIEQRLCRWLLLCHDRTVSSELLMTQELIAHMLGGRRESVTVAAGHLQDLGLIHYCRGRISILDRKGLESSACECYLVVEGEIERLYGRKRVRQPAGSTVLSKQPAEQAS